MDVQIDTSHATEYISKPDEGSFSRGSFLHRMMGEASGERKAKPAREESPPPAQDQAAQDDSDSEYVDSDSENELSSESDEDEDTSTAEPVGAEDPDQDSEPAEADNSDSGAEPKAQELIGGKFPDQASLLKSYNQLEAAQTQKAQELAEARWQVEQMTAALVAMRAQQASAECPPFEDLPPAEQEKWTRLAERQGFAPNQLHYLNWQNEQALAKREAGNVEARFKQIQAQQMQAEHEVNVYFQEQFSGPGEAEHVSKRYCEYPEFNAVLRSLSPNAIKRFGNRYMDLLGKEMRLERMEAEMAAKVEAARRSGRDEARRGRSQKMRSRSEASRAMPPQQKAMHPQSTSSQRSETGALIASLRDTKARPSRE